ncbi:DUF4259 domain-containing protein [Nocardioides litoris]|uniref:DUF4259 domain-containing protein n=1 Tax=Nocardioides litoris TaxID=1926648 RepID=UPI001476CE12|nr:DUF4259 domain-containing protein [Nocardioides litoris]
MGSWDAGAFDNDDAADWSGELDEARNPARFARETLRTAVRTTGYLEAPAGSAAVAAAAWFASAHDAAPPSAYAPSTRPPRLTRRHRRLATAALQRVRGTDSELRDLWEESGELVAFAGMVDELLEALATS